MRIECDRCKQLFNFNKATKITKGITNTELYICVDCLIELDKWMDATPVKTQEKRLRTFSELDNKTEVKVETTPPLKKKEDNSWYEGDSDLFDDSTNKIQMEPTGDCIECSASKEDRLRTFSKNNNE